MEYLELSDIEEGVIEIVADNRSVSPEYFVLQQLVERVQLDSIECEEMLKALMKISGSDMKHSLKDIVSKYEDEAQFLSEWYRDEQNSLLRFY